MNKKHLFILLAALLAAAVSCETYEKVPENSPFSIEAAVTPGSPAALVLTVIEGNHEGDCTLEADIRGAGGAAPDVRILLDGDATITPASAWRFDDDGKARFAIEGLPKGSYTASFTVRRWYHSATATVAFTQK